MPGYSKLFVLLLLAVLLSGCLGRTGDIPAAATRAVTATPFLPPTVTIAPSATITPRPTATFTITPTFTITATPEIAGCEKPPDDYTQVEVNGWTINARTLWMLQHAMALYGGELDITNDRITQGSYHDNGAASFGTHLGGGAVDLSVMRKGTYTIVKDDIEPLIHALRVAGFAAWLREYGELSPDSPWHIHAIAIGDAELSQAAEEQLTGTFGYFRGYTGVPIPSGIPAPDRHGGPILCQWMIDLGYEDLRDK